MTSYLRAPALRWRDQEDLQLRTKSLGWKTWEAATRPSSGGQVYRPRLPGRLDTCHWPAPAGWPLPSPCAHRAQTSPDAPGSPPCLLPSGPGCYSQWPKKPSAAVAEQLKLATPVILPALPATRADHRSRS